MIAPRGKGGRNGGLRFRLEQSGFEEVSSNSCIIRYYIVSNVTRLTTATLFRPLSLKQNENFARVENGIKIGE